MIYLHKIIPLFFSPLFLIIILILAGYIFKKRILSLIAIIILVISSIPIISNKLIYFLEIDYKPLKLTEINKADAIVVLSGMVKPIKKNNEIIYEFNDAVDRIFAGIDLLKNKKAPKLILTRGNLPWSKGVPEGEYLKTIAIKYGTLEKNIILTEKVQNTEQEAKSIKKILIKNNSKIILVTSAFHMDRAKKVFELNGLKVFAFPVDFRSTYENFKLFDLIPSAGSLGNTSFFIREMIGRAYYRLKY